MLDDKIHNLVQLALALTSQEWNYLGLGNDPLTQPTSDTALIVERITALMLIRCIPIITKNQRQQVQLNDSGNITEQLIATGGGKSTNIASSNVCIQLLNGSMNWPKDILTDIVIDELRQYINKIIVGYKDVPYHNKEHAFHVILSINKLVDMMVSGKDEIIVPTTTTNDTSSAGPKRAYPNHITYGLRHDPIALFALLFAALIHDVEHQGLPNRQLSSEDDRLAVLYNDQSIAENWSLYVGFSEFLQDPYRNFRHAVFPTGEGVPLDDYRRFRRIVIDLVLSTDIASPERTQINKSKWKEAFGDPFETVERKLKAAQNLHDNTRNVTIAGRRLSLTGRLIAPRRASHLSTISAVSFHGASHNNGDPGDNIYEYGEEESLSGTPDVSDNEAEYGNGGGGGRVNVNLRSDSLVMGAGLKRLERRLSMVSTNTNSSTKYRQRLGILRAVDLSGETIESYSRSGSVVGNMSMVIPPPRAVTRSVSGPQSSTGKVVVVVNDDAHTYPTEGTSTPPGLRRTPSNSVELDDPDELKATVVMETMITAADVAHNLQGWDHMVKWSDRLYLELRRAHVSKRGADPAERWFENQIGFLESYLLPLARRLEDTGVFNDQTIGETIFSSTVEFNRDRWLTDGFDVTQKSIERGNTRFPSSSSS